MNSPNRPAIGSTGVIVVLTMADNAPISAKTMAAQIEVTVAIHRPKCINSGSPFNSSDAYVKKEKKF